ncbi:unnamed protein product, partial [Rotaria socialis]
VDKDSDSSSTSLHQPQSETITTDASDIERRIRASRDQLTRKKTELEKLKQQKKKEDLKKQEDEIKKQLQAYEHEIETLRLQPASPKKQPEPKVSIPSRQLPTTSSTSSSSSSSIATPAKQQESSIAEDLPASGTSSQSKTNGVEKHVEATRPITTKRRDFFDDEEEEEEEKKPELKPLETPRDERDTLHDALSVSIATDIAADSSETENDDSRRPSADNLKPTLNLNTKAVSPLKSKTDSESSSSTTATSEKSSKKQSQSSERKPSIIANDYDEDFSEVTHSPANTSKESIVKPKIDNIDIESIQEDLDDKHSSHDTNRSSSSKSSDDEQSKILVLVKKSANTTPRRQDEKTPNDDDFFPSPAPLPPVTVPQAEIDFSNNNNNNNNNNDDTSHDVSDDDDEANERIEQEHKVDKLADSILRTFIDEAIGQSKQIQLLKKETSQKATELTQEAKEWMSDEEESDEESSKPVIVETDAFDLDFSRLEDKNSDERRVESPRKIVIEEQVKSFVPHTCEQVTQLCHEAIRILIDQNTDFTNRSAIKCQVPNSYFAYDQQDSDNEDIRRNRHAYCQMIFDLCIELLHEMYSENIQPAKYPEWQTSKLIPKRFYRGNQPQNRQHIEQFVQAKMLELLNLQPREITYTKWRVSKGANSGKEKFETVLDEEIRRTESQWITYNDDSIQLKFDIADSIFDQLIQDTITDCLDVADRRFYFSGDSTRL